MDLDQLETYFAGNGLQLLPTWVCDFSGGCEYSAARAVGGDLQPSFQALAEIGSSILSGGYDKADAIGGEPITTAIVPTWELHQSRVTRLQQRDGCCLEELSI